VNAIVDAGHHADTTEYSQTFTRACSLSAWGRRLFLGLVFTNGAVVALACAAIGAWPVLPWAGMELAGLAFAFCWIGRHDGDYERFSIAGATINLETKSAGRLERIEFNRQWAQLVCVVQGRRCDLALRSHGREVPVGRLMSDEERLKWARELARQLRVVSD
jgi:uncharacterized membrane protein